MISHMRAAAAACLIAAVSATATHAQQVEPIEFELDNGMTFLLLPRDEQPNIITAGWITPTGSTSERPGITGVSHLLEHLLFKGTDAVGTSDPELDLQYRAELTEVREAMRAMALDVQYPRYMRGEIDNPWDPENDTDELRELRAQMSALQDKQREITIKNEFDKIYTGNGGSGMNAGTSNDFTIYYINLPSNKLELWAWMESDRLMNPSFRELDAERFVVVEERRQRLEATPTGMLDERFDSMFWVASPYNTPVIGWMSDLMAYTEAEIFEYFETYYQPANLTGVIVGDFDPADARQLVESYFGRLINKRPPAPPVVTHDVPLMGELRFSGECDCQDQVEVRYRGVALGHPDEPALELLAAVLNGRTGRLYKSLIEDSAIAASANAGSNTNRYAGSFSFTASPKGKTALATLEEAWYEQVEILKNEMVSDMELQKVKNQARADSFRNLQNNSSLFFQLAISEGWVGWEHLNEYPKKMQSVTAEDIQRVAQTYLNDDRKGVASYTRKKGSEVELITLEDVKASLPAEMVEMIVPQLETQLIELKASDDVEELRMGLEQVKAQGASAPPQFKTMMDFVKQEIELRIAELEGGAE
ncbi:MAG: M16 family metallopeptidase [Phycisphaerales bacterium]